MKNLFAGQSQKIVPKSLSDCIQPDGVSKKLWHWAEKIEMWGGVIFVCLCFYAVISTIYEGITTYNTVVVLSSDDSVRATTTFFSIFTNICTFSIYAFLEYIIYHAITLLIGALASIVQNTNISTNLSLYNVMAKPGDEFPEPISDTKTENSDNNAENWYDNRGLDIKILNTKNNIETFDSMTQENFVDIKCPSCSNTLSFLNDVKTANCPYCDEKLTIN